MSRCLGVGLLCLSLPACGQTADLVIQGGAVWTGLSSGAPQPGAVAIGGGKVLAVGDSAAVARYLGARTRVMRADGGLVMPGFADGHTHFIGGGFQLASVDPRGAAERESGGVGKRGGLRGGRIILKKKMISREHVSYVHYT